MKLGFSYSRCLLDIYEGRVDPQDVLVIISRTNFDPNNEEHWSSIWRGYTIPNGWSDTVWAYHKDKEDEFRALTLKLWRAGKIHQPRIFGAHPPRENVIWRDVR